jgi:hypothetical protein
VEVASRLQQAGAPERLVVAGVLHDVIEATGVTAGDLRERFGARVAKLVFSVSENPRIAGYAMRKAALRRQVADAGEETLALFAADKISKLRELRREQAMELRPAGDHVRESRARRLRHYRACLHVVERRAPDSPLRPQLRAEFRMLLRDGAVRERLLAGVS